jgi:hypothetical protein
MGAVNDERRPADGTESADGAVHAADKDFLCAFEKLRRNRARVLLFCVV